MLILRPTLILARKLKLDPLEDWPPSEQPIADWCVRPFTCVRKPYLIFTNTYTLFSFVIPKRGITTAKTLRTGFANAVHLNLGRLTYGEQHISTILKALTDCRFSRCHDRAALGSMNDLVWCAQGYLERSDPLPLVNHYLNEAPMGLLGMDSPAKRLADVNI